VNHELKAKMLDAAILANKLWQRDMANTITAAIIEIDRLHLVLYEQGQRSAKVSEAMLTVLPFLRRVEQPTDEMFAAMCLGDTPYYVEPTPDDWQVRYKVDDHVTVLSSHEREEDANSALHRAAFYWRYHQMLRVASEQPIPNEEHAPA
jgi:hypothetical protein